MHFPSLHSLSLLLLAIFAFGTIAHAQTPWPVDYETDGIELGNGLILKPQAEGSIGYDDRVRYSETDGKTGDVYSDVAAAVELENQPSVYNLFLKGRYGYRFYASETELNNDFYTLAGNIGSKKEPFIWKAGADLTKSLNSNTTVSESTSPDPVLTYLANTRLKANVDAEYDKKWFGKTSLVPGYTFNYFNQQYEGRDYTTEWTIHKASLLARQQYSKKTRFSAGAAYSLQSRDVEDGQIGTLLVAMDYRMTKKTAWNVQLGYSVADYEISGTDQGVVSNLRGSWAFSKKVSFYAYGGNQFLPGYGGGSARWVYRLGYGASWQVVPKFRLSGSALHDYQQAIGDRRTSSSIYGKVRHYLNLSADYRPVDALSLITGLRHNRDERPVPQTQLYLQAVYRFY